MEKPVVWSGPEQQGQNGGGEEQREDCVRCCRTTTPSRIKSGRNSCIKKSLFKTCNVVIVRYG